MAGSVQLEGGRLRMWDADGVKTFDSDETVMYLTDVFQGTLNVPEFDNSGNLDDYRGQRVWNISGGPLKAGSTFAQGMVRLTMNLDGGVIWDREWMAIGGSLCTIQRQPGYTQTGAFGTKTGHLQTHLQYLTLDIQSNELVIVEDFGVSGTAGTGFNFKIPALTLNYVLAVGGFN